MAAAFADSTWASSMGWTAGNGTGNVPTRDTANARSGAACFKCDSAANVTSHLGTNVTLAINTTYLMRAYIRTTLVPGGISPQIMGGSAPFITIFTGGVLRCFAGGAAQGDSTAVVNDNAWHCVEMSFTISGTVTIYTAAEARLDGTRFAAWSGSTSFASPGSVFNCGWCTAPGSGLPNSVLYVDDLAVNDNTGAAQNTWPGEGKVVLLLPISPDNARGANWVAGAGGTTNLWDAVNNVPPAGAATGTNTSQLHNITKDTTGNYDANLTTYTTAGVGATDIVNIVQPIWNVSGANATAAAQLVSNPVANAGAASTVSWTGFAPGAFPTNWNWVAPPAQFVYNPAVAKGTSPVLRVGIRTNATTEIAVDFMGALVEYAPPRSLVYTDRRRARNPLLRR